MTHGRATLISDDWTLTREMKAITRHLAQLSLSEVQSQTLVAAFMVAAERKLKSRSFPCLTLRAPSSCSRSESDQERKDILLENFTDAGRVCLERCRAQVRNRFPSLTVQEVVSLLLDPRTKTVREASSTAWTVLQCTGNAF
jgi:hypothetical protein